MSEERTPGPKWYVVIAKQNQDALVVKGLREQGYDAYSPKTYVRERLNGRVMSVGRRRLSPYIFVKCDASKGEASPIRNTRGVDTIVPEGRDPEPLRHGEATITWLRLIEEEEFSESDKSPKKGRTDLEVNERVRIVSGNNKNWIGIEGVIAHLQRGKVDVFVGTAVIRGIPDVDLASVNPKPLKDLSSKKKRGRRR